MTLVHGLRLAPCDTRPTFPIGESALGIAIVGELVVSQILTLYTTPVVFLYVERLRNWWQLRQSALETVAA